MFLPNSVKRKTLVKNRSDRCKNEENRTDGELKLMDIHYELLYPADLTSNP